MALTYLAPPKHKKWCSHWQVYCCCCCCYYYYHYHHHHHHYWRYILK